MTDNILLKNVRISFPCLFQRSTFDGKEGKYSANFMLDPQQHRTELKEIKAQINALIKDRLKGRVLPPEKLCLRAGEDKGRPEYEGVYVITASNDVRPIVLNKDKSMVTEDDNLIYSGCRVNASLSLWVQNNQFGKRINATLRGVQFCGDDTPLNGTYVDPEVVVDEFDMLNVHDDFLEA